ncbi:MAG: hypothetical protein AAF604_14805 [Acidobacteriota bacterium]
MRPASAYDPVFTGTSTDDSLERVQARFEEASEPYLRSPFNWLAWSVLLPAAALLTPTAQRGFGVSGPLLLWSLAVLLGGAVEGLLIFPRAPRQGKHRSLSAWVFRLQGNISLVAAALSALLLWSGLAWAVPALWLLLLGHSFYGIGGLSVTAFRTYGLIYQAAGFAALWPSGWSLHIFAAGTLVANLWMAWSVRTS